MKHKLKMDPEEVVGRVAEMVAYAKSLCEGVEFSPEDAGRSDPEFLYVVLGEAIKAGANDFLVKPFSQDALDHVLERLNSHRPSGSASMELVTENPGMQALLRSTLIGAPETGSFSLRHSLATAGTRAHHCPGSTLQPISEDPP